MTVNAAPFPVQRTLTAEELALLRHSDLRENPTDDKQYEERGHPSPPSFRERCALGEISW